jgi:hypothetical protein
LAGHLHDLAPARRALPLIGRQRVADLDGRERRLFAGAVAWLRLPWRGRRGGWRALKDLGARLLQLTLDRERELLDVRDATQARELRRQLEILRNEALVFAIEEEVRSGGVSRRRVRQ